MPKSASRTDSSRGELARNKTCIPSSFRTKCFQPSQLYGGVDLERKAPWERRSFTECDASSHRFGHVNKHHSFGLCHSSSVISLIPHPFPLLFGKRRGDQTVPAFVREFSNEKADSLQAPLPASSSLKLLNGVAATAKQCEQTVRTTHMSGANNDKIRMAAAQILFNLRQPIPIAYADKAIAK